MPLHDKLWSRRGFITTAGATAVGSVAVGGLAATHAPSASAAARVSYVDTSRSTYDKLVLMVDGKPFYHSGIQFRYEKHKITYGWTDDELAPVLPMISEDGFTVVNISIWWSQVEPEKNEFDWTEIDRYIDLCQQNGLKLELLWFGTDSGGSSVGQGPRLPDYVTSDYQWVVDENGDQVWDGDYALLDKTDPNLLEREKHVLGRLMQHVASYDTEHTLVGVQTLNEPNVSSVWGVDLDRSYSDYSNELWESGGYTDAAQFRNDVLLTYVTHLARVVKDSDHSVWTRCNVIGDAKPIAKNEALREQGQAYLDFFGDDPYTTNREHIYSYGTDDFWAQGRNFPMIMETYAGASTSDILKFNGISGNAAFNMYAVLDPDSETGSSDFGFYDFDPETKQITRKDVTGRISALNHLLNKVSRDLATKSPVEAGGRLLQTFNHAGTADYESTKPLGDSSVTYRTSQSGQALAVKRGQTEFALLDTAEGAFELPGTLEPEGSVEAGHYDENDAWVSSGSKPYEQNNDSISVTVAASECVRILGLR